MDGGSVSGTLSISRLRFRNCLESNTVIRDRIAAKSGRLAPPASTTKGVFAMEPIQNQLDLLSTSYTDLWWRLWLTHYPPHLECCGWIRWSWCLGCSLCLCSWGFGIVYTLLVCGLRMCFGGLWIRYVWNMWGGWIGSVVLSKANRQTDGDEVFHQSRGGKNQRE